MNAPFFAPTARIDGASWEPRYREALGTTRERGAFMQIAAEMEAVDEPLWAAFYDLATTDDAEFRAELLKEVEYDFATYAAREAYEEAAYAYEVCTGRSADDAGSPYWDRSAWIDSYVRSAAA